MSVNRSGDRAAARVAAGRRVRNPQGQGGRLRAELLAAADGILARTGDVEGLSLRAVAREVGVATPSIYLHFADKRALVRAVLDARFRELGSAVEAAVREHSEPAAQLRAGCLAYCTFAVEHPHAYRILFGRVPARPRAGAAGPGPADAAQRVGARSAADDGAARPPAAPGAGAASFGFLVDGIHRCMQAGLAPASEPRRVATNVWAALHGLVSLRAGLPDFPWPPLAQQLDDVLHGLVGIRRATPS